MPTRCSFMTRNGRVTFMTASKEKCHAKPQARKAKKKAAPPPPPPAQQARNNSNNQTRSGRAVRAPARL